MNWLPWTTPRTAPDDCDSLDPLLSLYADGMASPQEVRRVESHLPGCAECRQSLLWMQATRRALAARPVVPPPHDLRARIAEAIAASSAAPLAARPVRSFRLRPAFAAAASLSVIGLLSYGLLHAPAPPETVHPQPPAAVATVPHTGALPVTPGAVVRPAASPQPLHHASPVLPDAGRMAVVPSESSEVITLAPPAAEPPSARNTATVRPPAPNVAPLVPAKPRLPRLQKRTAPRPSVTLMAHQNVRPDVSPAHHAPVPEPSRGPSVASSHIPDEIILPATIHNDFEPPTVRAASAESHLHAPGLLDDVNKAVVRMREAGFVRPRLSLTSAVIATHRIDSDSSATYAPLYTPR
jgi:hypothetical protein